MIKHLFLTFCLSIAGCGTISTVGNDNYTVGSNLLKKGSRCSTMPRVYSGVGFNICTMNSDPTDYGTILLAFSVIDTVLSAGLDTLALPYTIYSQNNEGDFNLREHIQR